LLLNYINAAVALPKMQSEVQFGWLTLITLVALLNCVAGLLAARLIGATTHSPPEVVVALDYGLMMKNTGLALALAHDVLGHQHLVVLPLFAATLMQHLVAGWHHARVQARLGQGSTIGPHFGSTGDSES